MEKMIWLFSFYDLQHHSPEPHISVFVLVFWPGVNVIKHFFFGTGDEAKSARVFVPLSSLSSQVW